MIGLTLVMTCAPFSDTSVVQPCAGVDLDARAFESVGDGIDLTEELERLKAEGRWLERLHKRMSNSERQLLLQHAFRKRLATVILESHAIRKPAIRSSSSRGVHEDFWSLYAKASRHEIRDAPLAPEDEVELRFERLQIAQLVDLRSSLRTQQEDVLRIAQLIFLDRTRGSAEGVELPDSVESTQTSGPLVRTRFLSALEHTVQGMQAHAPDAAAPVENLLDDLLTKLISLEDQALSLGVAEILLPIRTRPEGTALAGANLWDTALKDLAVEKLCEPLKAAIKEGVEEHGGHEFPRVLPSLQALSRRLDATDLGKQLVRYWAPVRFEASNWIGRLPTTETRETRQLWDLVPFQGPATDNSSPLLGHGGIEIDQLDWLDEDGPSQDFLPVWEGLKELGIPLVLPEGYYRIVLRSVLPPGSGVQVKLIANVEGIDLTRISVPSVVPIGDFIALACIETPDRHGLILSPPGRATDILDAINSTLDGLDDETHNFARMLKIVELFGQRTSLGSYDQNRLQSLRMSSSSSDRAAGLDDVKHWFENQRAELPPDTAKGPWFQVDGAPSKRDLSRVSDLVQELRTMTTEGLFGDLGLPLAGPIEPKGRYDQPPPRLAHQLLIEHARLGDPLGCMTDFALACADRRRGPLHIANIEGLPAPVSRAQGESPPSPPGILVRFVIQPSHQ